MNTNTNTSHPLIPNSQEYIVYKKYVSIHSEDIDTSKYTTSCFEIELPQDYLNVLSVKLANINLPANSIYNFSQALGNTTIYFDISLNGMNVSLSAICFPDGAYSVQNIVNTTISTITQAMNTAVSNYLGSVYNKFNIYTKLNQFGIINNDKDSPANSFTLKNIIQNTQFPIQNTCTNLLGCNNGYYPSFTGSLYYAIGYTGNETSSVIDPTGNYNAVTTNPPIDPFNNDIPLCNYDTYNYIYMEIDGLNNLDEYPPYTDNQYNMVNSGNSGIVNSSFAKIEISTALNILYPPFTKDPLYNYKYFNPPAERIRKLKIKFRYNNNVLVNFNGGSYNFLLEFTLYENQIQRKNNLSRPVIQV
jgi:hypothetical protein